MRIIPIQKRLKILEFTLFFSSLPQQLFSILFINSLLHSNLNVFLSLEKLQFFHNIFYPGTPKLLSLLFSNKHKNTILHLYPLLPWQRNNITTNKCCRLFYSSKSIKPLSMKKISDYKLPPINKSYIKLILYTSSFIYVWSEKDYSL